MQEVPVPDAVTPIRKLPPLSFPRRDKECHPARIAARHFEAIEPFRKDRGMTKGESIDYLLDRAFELTPAYEKSWEQLNQMSKVRGISPLEMLDLLIEAGLEASVHESDRQEKIHPLNRKRYVA